MYTTKHDNDDFHLLSSPTGNRSPEESIPRLWEARGVTTSTTDARSALTTRLRLRKHFLNVPFPVLLFFAFVAVVLTHTPTNHVFNVNHGLANVLNPLAADVVKRPGYCEFSNIRTGDDFETWFEDTLMVAVFTTPLFNNSGLENATIGRVASYNQIIGAVEVSVLNVPKTACPSDGHLASHYGDCYDFKTEYAITDGDLATRNTRLRPWYTLHLPLQEPDPYAKFAAWKLNGTMNGYYINLGTRQVDVKLTTYNGELDVFTYLRFRLEFQPGGYIDPTFMMKSLPPNPYANSMLNPVLDAIVGLLTLRLLSRRVRVLLRRVTTGQPWVRGADYIEWTSVACLVLYYISWGHIVQRSFGSDFEEKVAKLREFYDAVYQKPETERERALALSPQPEVSDFMDGIAPALDFLYVTSILTCLQLAVHVMAALHFHPTMSILSNTIITSVQRLGTFLFLFLLVVVALATSGCLLFGPQLEDFASLDAAMVTCINVIFNSYDYKNLKDVNPFAIVWFWLNQAIITLVLVNIMLAVIIAAHEDIVRVNHGNRSFTKEMLWVLQDVIQVDWRCNRRKVQQMTERVALGDDGRSWTAGDFAEVLGVSNAQGVQWVCKLKRIASLHEPPRSDASRTTIVVRPGSADTTTGHQRLEDRMSMMSAQLTALLKHMQLQEERMLQAV